VDTYGEPAAGSPPVIADVRPSQGCHVNWNFSTLEVVLGTTLSIVGVYLGYKRYALKSGIRFRGSFTPTSSIYCEDRYVSRVAIENVKDRAATIYAIYLKIGPNVYLTIEDFGDEPLVLGGFETYQKDFDPVDFYTEGTRRIELKVLFENKQLTKRIVLSTSEGKYVVRKWIRRWDPIVDFFKNYATAIVYPMRMTYKGRAYGSNALYVVELQLDDGTEQVMPVYARDYEIRRFRSFALTKESLESKAALENLLNQEREAGNLPVHSLEVRDLREMRVDSYEDDFKETVDAPKTSWLAYHLLGPVLTRIHNWKLRMENKRRRRKTI